MQCPEHGVEFVQKPAGISKKTGRPYNAFWVCPTFGCSQKPNQPQSGGWQSVREQIAARVAPEKASMSKADWEAKEARTNKNILLQVAFKAAVEMYGDDKVNMASNLATVKDVTLQLHQWLLSQTVKSSPRVISEATDVGNTAIEEAQAELPPLNIYVEGAE